MTTPTRITLEQALEGARVAAVQTILHVGSLHSIIMVHGRDGSIAIGLQIPPHNHVDRHRYVQQAGELAGRRGDVGPPDAVTMAGETWTLDMAFTTIAAARAEVARYGSVANHPKRSERLSIEAYDLRDKRSLYAEYRMIRDADGKLQDVVLEKQGDQAVVESILREFAWGYRAGYAARRTR